MMRARSTLRMMASTLQLLKRRRRTDAAIKIQGVLMMNLANKMLFQKNKVKAGRGTKDTHISEAFRRGEIGQQIYCPCDFRSTLLAPPPPVHSQLGVLF